ncbi:MAG: multiheme c-type cytochrome [Planctomycetota bacterium]
MNKSGKLLAMLCGGMFLLLFAGSSCNRKGDTGPAGATGPTGSTGSAPLQPTELTKFDDLPGVNITITGLSGGSGAGGAFEVGDHIKVTFKLAETNGTALTTGDLSSTGILVSGPSFNYQPVIYSQSDLVSKAVSNGDGTYTYTFASAIPATYQAPLNSSGQFTAGVLNGQALLSGSYTVGIQAYRNITIQGTTYRDAGATTSDFLFGTATSIDHREEVKTSNCNQCHVTIQAHGGSRSGDVSYCILCHTAGAEDNAHSPGVTIEFKSMIHKIHMGEHLPSVNGLGVDASGNADYTVTPKPFQVVGYHGSTNDFSGVVFPVWPSLNVTMPRNNGYSSLTSAAQKIDNTVREGPVACYVCHGDPDGAGPLTAPAEGNQINTQPSRRSCGACHDNVDFTKPFILNGLTMPPQLNDSNCVVCHLSTGPSLLGQPPATPDAHLHPLLNSTLNPGLNFNVSALTEAGTNNGNGKIDPGEKVAVTFSPVENDGSTAVPPSSITSMYITVGGPSYNRNMLVYASVPTAELTGSAPYTVNVPEPVLYEYVGTAANDGAIETFNTSRTPTYDSVGVPSAVYCRTASGAATTATAANGAGFDWIDVASTAGIAANGYIVIDDGTASVEYKKVRFVNTTLNRVYFLGNSYNQQAGLKYNHAVGATVQPVTLTQKTLTTDYTVNSATGVVTEAANASFPAGDAVVVSYTSDFVMPAVYGPSLNNSADLGETIGCWTGKSIVDGTSLLSKTGLN